MLYNMKNTHGGDIYRNRIMLDFSVSINPFGTPEGVREAIRNAADLAACYPDPQCSELVKAIAESEDVPEEWILCGNGAAELIYAYCQARGSVDGLETAPAFSEYARGVELTGGTVHRYPLNPEQDFLLDAGFADCLEKWCSSADCCEGKNSQWQISSESFLKTGSCGPENVRPQPGFSQTDSPGNDSSLPQSPRLHRNRAVFLCNPNNPDGRNIPRQLLEEILCRCASHGAGLFLDECFLAMSDHPESMKSFLPDHPELFILKAFTKDYGMAGVRLGYGLCSDRDLLAHMSRQVQPWNVSLPAQMAGVAALKEREWVSRARAMIPEERNLMAAELRRLGFRVCQSEANYFLVQGPPGIDRELLKYGIAIRNCADFCNLSEGWYRIGLKLHEENETLIRTLILLGRQS